MKLTLQFLIIVLTLGCATAPPGHDTARQIQSATGLANAIEFHTNALPAEAAPAADTLSLSDAIERALRQSPEIQIALANVRAAQAGAHQSRLLSNPVLDIAFRLPEGGGSTVIEAGLGAELIKILQRPRRIGAADAALRSASAKAVSSALEIVQQTQQHYFDAVALRLETQILTERKERIGELLKVAEARLAAGEGTQLDVATLKAEQATAEIDLQEGNRKLKTTQLALAHRLGQPSGHVSWQLSTLLKTQIALRKESDVIAHGLRVQPEIQADRWQLAALEDRTALARLAWMEGAAAGLDAEHDGDWSLGPSLTLPLPIFDWGQAKRTKARAQAIAARQRLTQSTRRIVREIRQSHAAVSQLLNTTDQARNQLVPLHEERVRLAKVVFDAGQEDVTRLRLAELDLLNAQLKLVRLEHRTALAIVALNRATGGSTDPSPSNHD